MMIFLGIICVFLIGSAFVMLLTGLELIRDFITGIEWDDLAGAGMAIAISAILCIVVQWIVEKWFL